MLEVLARRRWLRRLPALLPALALVFGLVVGGTHHHAQESGSHACAICSLSHLPAAATAALVASAAPTRVERVVVDVHASPRATRIAAPCSRAPPALRARSEHDPAGIGGAAITAA